ncbi:AAEL007781-PA [Aedes aegypti]|uniref:AAEL007781-PA n=1 Tax=Aedes aegypti TaxID=7159 RepID=Q170W2_AEDAE|nr:AAEL007781-PA [Aedes aegypti]
MGSTSGAQYYVIFCDILPMNSGKLMDFVISRLLLHGEARYIFVTFLNNNEWYDSRYFVRDNDRFRFHYLFMIKYDAYGMYEAAFIDPFLRLERPYDPGQNIERTFKTELRNIHGYRFELRFSRLTYTSRQGFSQYWYFLETVAKARGGNVSLLPPPNGDNLTPDIMIVEDIYFDPTQLGMYKLLPMNRFRYLCAVTPALAEEIPWLWIFIDPFQWTVWMAFLLVVELLVLFVYRFGYQGRSRRSFLTIHFEIYQTFMDGPSNRKRTQLENYLNCMFLLMSMILIAVYESALVSSMSLRRFYPEIDTIDEVNNSKFPVVIVKRVTDQFNLHFKNVKFIWEEERPENNSLYEITDFQHVIPCESVPFYVEGVTHGRFHKVSEYFGSKTDNFVIGRFSPYGEILFDYWNSFMEGDLFTYWLLREFVPKYFDGTSGHLDP